MERAGDRWEEVAGYWSTGQSPQRAVLLMEEEEEGPSIRIPLCPVATGSEHELWHGMPGFNSRQK
jgi:hypothetical protein